MSRALTNNPEKPPETLIRFLREHTSTDRFINVNDEQVLYIASLVAEYMRRTTPGKRALMKELSVQEMPANPAKQYFPEGALGVEARRLDPRKLIEFRGWFYEWTDSDGYHVITVPGNKIEVHDRPNLESCEKCNTQVVKSYCSRLTRDIVGGRETFVTTCNHCRMFSENPRIRDESSQKICTDCPLTSCQFHPKRREISPPPRGIYEQAVKSGIGGPQPPHPADLPMLEHKPQTQPTGWGSSRYSAI